MAFYEIQPHVQAGTLKKVYKLVNFEQGYVELIKPRT